MSDTLSFDESASDYEWGSYESLGDDPDDADYLEHPRLQPGGGYYTPAGFHEIGRLERGDDGNVRVFVRSPTDRQNGTRPKRRRAKDLVQRHENDGGGGDDMILLTPEEAQACRQFDQQVREAVNDESRSIGATWFDGRLVSVFSEGECVWSVGDPFAQAFEVLGLGDEAEDEDEDEDEDGGEGQGVGR